MYSYGPPHMDELKQDDQLEHTYSSYVRIPDVAQKTCQGRWTIGKSGERGSGIFVLAARNNDDDVWFRRKWTLRNEIVRRILTYGLFYGRCCMCTWIYISWLGGVIVINSNIFGCRTEQVLFTFPDSIVYIEFQLCSLF